MDVAAPGGSGHPKRVRASLQRSAMHAERRCAHVLRHTSCGVAPIRGGGGYSNAETLSSQVVVCANSRPQIAIGGRACDAPPPPASQRQVCQLGGDDRQPRRLAALLQRPKVVALHPPQLKRARGEAGPALEEIRRQKGSCDAGLRGAPSTSEANACCPCPVSACRPPRAAQPCSAPPTPAARRRQAECTCNMAAEMRRSAVPQKAVTGKGKGGAPPCLCSYSSNRVKSARIRGCAGVCGRGSMHGEVAPPPEAPPCERWGRQAGSGQAAAGQRPGSGGGHAAGNLVGAPQCLREDQLIHVPGPALLLHGAARRG